MPSHPVGQLIRPIDIGVRYVAPPQPGYRPFDPSEPINGAGWRPPFQRELSPEELADRARSKRERLGGK